VLHDVVELVVAGLGGGLHEGRAHALLQLGALGGVAAITFRQMPLA
jgi:hypothetical protein